MCIAIAFTLIWLWHEPVGHQMPIETLDNRRLTIKGYIAVKRAKKQKETKSKYICYTDFVMKKCFYILNNITNYSQNKK